MKSESIRTAQANGSFTVLFDSGIRTGSDIIKAVALGANAVLCKCHELRQITLFFNHFLTMVIRFSLVGRPYVYGLALEGETGVENVIRNILCELHITLGLIGHKSIKDIHGKADKLLFWEP